MAGLNEFINVSYSYSISRNLRIKGQCTPLLIAGHDYRSTTIVYNKRFVS